jgi:hypothetical protein
MVGECFVNSSFQFRGLPLRDIVKAFQLALHSCRVPHFDLVLNIGFGPKTQSHLAPCYRHNKTERRRCSQGSAYCCSLQRLSTILMAFLRPGDCHLLVIVMMGTVDRRGVLLGKHFLRGDTDSCSRKSFGFETVLLRGCSLAWDGQGDRSPLPTLVSDIQICCTLLNHLHFCIRYVPG